MTFVHPTAHIGANVELGRGVYVGPHASIEDAVVGNACRVEAGARIGERGHGFDWDEEVGWSPKPHNFKVVLEDCVWIGCNTCVDRGSWRDTRVGAYTKVDNLVHIAHNVWTGADCMIIAGAEVSGSVTLMDRVYVGPNACIRERLMVGGGSIVGMGAVVVKDVPDDVVVAGVPARVLGPVTEWPPAPPR